MVVGIVWYGLDVFFFVEVDNVFMREFLNDFVYWEDFCEFLYGNVFFNEEEFLYFVVGYLNGGNYELMKDLRVIVNVIVGNVIIEIVLVVERIVEVEGED